MPRKKNCTTNQDLSVSEFLSILHRDGAYAYLWTRPARRSFWWEAKTAQPDIPNGPRHQDVYFGVHTARAIPQFDENDVEQPKENVRAKVADVDVVNCLFSDFDAKRFGGSLDETRAHIAALNNPPTFSVCSGGGIHAYWVFDEPWHLVNGADHQRATQLQRAWVARVGADPAAADLARVLRLPGTINHKPEYGDQGARVEFEIFEPGRVYTRAALEAEVGPEALEPKAEPARRKGRVLSADELEQIQAAVADLSPQRADIYSAWVEIGMALAELGSVGFELWRNWSAKSPKYRRGECEYKWATFKPFAGITLKTLFARADEDRQATAPGPHITRAKRPMTTTQVENALGELGLHFAVNEMTGVIHVNGEPMDDFRHDDIYGDLYNHRYYSERLMGAAITRLASRNHFHPVRDYLNSLTWDGRDHIGRLCGYFSDEHDVFSSWLPKWLIGAVARVMRPRVQNRVLVLDGPQNLGKSYFAQWLFSPLPELFIEAAVDPDDKDCRMRRAFVWGWELDEMGSTLRRRDAEALKAFITNTAMTERVPYGRHSQVLKPIASFIGTINNQSGFLNDETGSRRFMVATLTRVDWNYAAEVDINQVWAQASAMLAAGVDWRLSGEEYQLSEKLNRDNYQADDPLKEIIQDLLVMDKQGEFSSAALLNLLRKGGFIRSITDRADAMRAAVVLKSLGLRKAKIMVGGQQRKGWIGAKFSDKAKNIEMWSQGLEEGN